MDERHATRLEDVTSARSSEPMFWRPWRIWTRDSMRAAIKALADRHPCPACHAKLVALLDRLDAAPHENPLLVCTDPECNWSLSVDPAGVEGAA